MEIRLCRPDMRMAHQRLDSPKILAIIQKCRGEAMAHNVRTDPLLDQCLFTTGLMRQSTDLWL